MQRVSLTGHRQSLPEASALFQLLKPITWGMALGQAFFSVSLTGAAMLVYGSYLTDDFDIPGAALSTVTLDTLMALMAGAIRARFQPATVRNS